MSKFIKQKTTDYTCLQIVCLRTNRWKYGHWFCVFLVVCIRKCMRACLDGNSHNCKLSMWYWQKHVTCWIIFTTLTSHTVHRLHKLIIESVTNRSVFVFENSLTRALSIALYDLWERQIKAFKSKSCTSAPLVSKASAPGEIRAGVLHSPYCYSLSELEWTAPVQERDKNWPSQELQAGLENNKSCLGPLRFHHL